MAVASGHTNFNQTDMCVMTKRAKTLNNDQLQIVLKHVALTSDTPIRDYVLLLFSFKAGLRAAEIAGLEWSDVTDAFGNIGRTIDTEKYFEIPGSIAKKGRGRVVPMHPALEAALGALRATLPARLTRGRQRIVRGTHSPSMTSGAIQQYVRRLYTALGLDGCSSHSGRRSFVTAMARSANDHGCSLMDVQAIAGHAFVSTTEAYVDLSKKTARMVSAI